MALGQRLKACRKAKGLTQHELANILGLNRSTYAKYETGDNEPDNDTLQKLADFFDVQVDYLFGRTDDPTPPYQLPNSEKPLMVSEKKYDYRDDPRVHGELKELLDIIVRLPEEQQKRIIEQTLVFAAGLQAKNRSSEKE